MEHGKNITCMSSEHRRGSSRNTGLSNTLKMSCVFGGICRNRNCRRIAEEGFKFPAMFKCPHCDSDLRPDAHHPGKVLCYTCMKRYSEDKIAEYWRIHEATPDSFQDADVPEVSPGQREGEQGAGEARRVSVFDKARASGKISSVSPRRKREEAPGNGESPVVSAIPVPAAEPEADSGSVPSDTVEPAPAKPAQPEESAAMPAEPAPAPEMPGASGRGGKAAETVTRKPSNPFSSAAYRGSGIGYDHNDVPLVPLDLDAIIREAAEAPEEEPEVPDDTVSAGQPKTVEVLLPVLSIEDLLEIEAPPEEPEVVEAIYVGKNTRKEKPQPGAVPVPAPEPAAPPVPVPEPAPEPEPASEPEPAPEPEPKREEPPAPVVAVEPQVSSPSPDAGVTVEFPDAAESQGNPEPGFPGLDDEFADAADIYGQGAGSEQPFGPFGGTRPGGSPSDPRPGQPFGPDSGFASPEPPDGGMGGIPDFDDAASPASQVSPDGRTRPFAEGLDGRHRPSDGQEPEKPGKAPKGVRNPKRAFPIAVASFAAGILAIATCWIHLVNVASTLLGLIAVALGVFFISQMKKGYSRGFMFAVAGAAIGFTSIVAALLMNTALSDFAWDPFGSEGSAGEELIINSDDGFDLSGQPKAPDQQASAGGEDQPAGQDGGDGEEQADIPDTAEMHWAPDGNYYFEFHLDGESDYRKYPLMEGDPMKGEGVLGKFCEENNLRPSNYLLSDTLAGYKSVNVRIESDAVLFIIWAVNPTGDPLPLRSLLIGSVQATVKEGKNPHFRLPEDMKLGVSTSSAFIKAYGEPSLRRYPENYQDLDAQVNYDYQVTSGESPALTVMFPNDHGNAPAMEITYSHPRAEAYEHGEPTSGIDED